MLGLRLSCSPSLIILFIIYTFLFFAITENSADPAWYLGLPIIKYHCCYFNLFNIS
ncbi:hypothetical protein ECFRIK1996_5949 [Escherichia coli FRIK1996]|nr:hypothetical protein ECFRIK1996_5949 [Escherichia coli FRIK1996]EKH31548.1 hypothetical protein ECFRIK1997_6052 [Escherichia coli FRIK1997]EKL43603.1 hypothetical protein ACIN5074_A0014 [Acinetobacter baumannii OIFC074]